MSRRYPFEGAEVTPAELARCVCYSETWIAQALRAGCTSKADLARRYHESMQRKRAGNLRGSASLKRSDQARFRARD